MAETEQVDVPTEGDTDLPEAPEHTDEAPQQQAEAASEESQAEGDAAEGDADEGDTDKGVTPMRVRFDLAYEGTDFAGWARQPGQRTVQGVLEAALAQVLRLADPPALTVAGRTDAGVHARGQVAHADLDVRPAAALAQRRAARRRARLACGGSAARLRCPFLGALAALQLPGHRRVPSTRCAGATPSPGPTPLDVDAMNDAARLLLGEHDFAAFCKRREGATTIRRLLALSWTRGADGVLEADRGGRRVLPLDGPGAGRGAARRRRGPPSSRPGRPGARRRACAIPA